MTTVSSKWKGTALLQQPSVLEIDLVCDGCANLWFLRAM